MLDRDIIRWKAEMWRILLNLNTPNLMPPAVQWAVLDEDPIPDFSVRIKNARTRYRERLERADDDTKKELVRLSQMTAIWDSGFKGVTGDQLYLLTSSPGICQTVSSNAPDGEKWIVTKIVQIKDQPACWCIPIRVKTGKEIDITLKDDNLFDLAIIFDNAMHELG